MVNFVRKLSTISCIYPRETTNLTRLQVAPEPHETLIKYYTRTLRLLSKMPQDSVYRQSTEAIVKSRLALVETEKDVLQLEKKINNGLIEEVILQADRELQLCRNMLLWKPWEPLVAEAPKNQWQWPPM